MYHIHIISYQKEYLLCQLDMIVSGGGGVYTPEILRNGYQKMMRLEDASNIP